ncbi:hypothetical protein [Nocardia gipuzkoensis]|jgi:hypothetical protein
MAELNSKGPAPVSLPVDQAQTETGGKPATLTLTYTDKGPVLTATDGNVIPGPIPVVDSAGNLVAECVVTAPRNREIPVVVWIYGGGFLIGDSENWK